MAALSVGYGRFYGVTGIRIGWRLWSRFNSRHAINFGGGDADDVILAFGFGYRYAIYARSTHVEDVAMSVVTLVQHVGVLSVVSEGARQYCCYGCRYADDWRRLRVTRHTSPRHCSAIDTPAVTAGELVMAMVVGAKSLPVKIAAERCRFIRRVGVGYCH